AIQSVQPAEARRTAFSGCLMQGRGQVGLNVSVELPPRATAGGRLAEVAMHDELAARQRAITSPLDGRPTKAICAAVGRSEVWFRKWWGRYLGAGGTYPVAGDPAVPALRRQPGVHPRRGAAVQRQRRELQRLVPGTAVRPPLPADRRPAPGAGAATR